MWSDDARKGYMNVCQKRMLYNKRGLQYYHIATSRK